ncbi:thioredoxin-like protein [Schizothecium vesticola]|uniref:Thioredoxin-like protein n=1 Tax=Schizothecium vesticola TaxID=314040 RepID=A0AA40BTN1_9PEZI|nr:thioredoxin-like protein [Schizothecium vesticola]
MAAAATAFLSKIFRRKKPAPLVCSVSLDASDDHDHDHPPHQHTAACFLPFEPLAVLELFQSQGCPACPPAIPAILEGAAQQGPNALLLSYNVTLFDHLGWKDTLADARLGDARQRAYARRWGRKDLYTPMVVGNGSVDGPGAGGKGELDGIVARSRAVNGELGWIVYLDVNDQDNAVRIDSDRVEGDGGEVFEVVMAVYDPRPQTVKVKGGANKGKKLEHRNVVTELVRVGEWSGGNATLPLPVTKGHEAVVFLQGQGGGKILAAAKL